MLNSAAALHIAKGIPLEEAVREAERILDSGKGMEQLERFIARSNQI